MDYFKIICQLKKQDTVEILLMRENETVKAVLKSELIGINLNYILHVIKCTKKYLVKIIIIL